MIWGKTWQERFAKREKQKEEDKIWRSWFAWYPVQLHKCERWVWWQIIEWKYDNTYDDDRDGTISRINYYRLKNRS